MKTTRVFSKTLDAYVSGKRYIINRGGTRSSKSFSTLQLLFIIAKNSKKSRVIHCVSHSTPHLTDGIVSDFDNILIGEGVDIDSVKTKNPNTYKIGKCVVKFLGFDKLGKALGAARNILFVNEANKMDWDVVHQLMVRTTETVFLDYNPSQTFWITEKGYTTREDAIVINSTFRDNIENLTKGQIDELLFAKQKHDEEKAANKQGYWYNYWRVYGEGQDGILLGAIFTNWTQGTFDESLPHCFVIDWGRKDNFTLSKVAVDTRKRKIYVQNYVYESNDKISTAIIHRHVRNHCRPASHPNPDVIVCDHATDTGVNDLREADYNAIYCHKGPGSIVRGIQDMMSFQIISCDSPNFDYELSNYIWNDKKSYTPIDKFCDIIDPVRYGFDFLMGRY